MSDIEWVEQEEVLVVGELESGLGVAEKGVHSLPVFFRLPGEGDLGLWVEVAKLGWHHGE